MNRSNNILRRSAAIAPSLGVGLLAVLALTACTTVKPVDESNFDQYRQAINENGARQTAVIIFNHGEKLKVRGLRLAADSTSFIYQTISGDDVVGLIATESIQEIRFQRPGRQFGLGFLAGAALGALMGFTVGDIEEVCTEVYHPPAENCWLCWSGTTTECHYDTHPGLKPAGGYALAGGLLVGFLSSLRFGDHYRFTPALDKSRPYMTIPSQ